jgi:hypothetical protein
MHPISTVYKMDAQFFSPTQTDRKVHKIPSVILQLLTIPIIIPPQRQAIILRPSSSSGQHQFSLRGQASGSSWFPGVRIGSLRCHHNISRFGCHWLARISSFESLQSNRQEGSETPTCSAVPKCNISALDQAILWTHGRQRTN